MKKLLLSIAVVSASFLSLNAQTVVYDFGKIYGPDLETAGGTTLVLQTKGDLIMLNSTSKVVLENNVKSSEGVIYTHRMKLGGKATIDPANGLPKYCSFGVPVSGPGTFKFVVLTGSNGSLDRSIDYAHISTEGEATEGTTSLCAKEIDPDKASIDGVDYDHIAPQTWSYKGKPGTIYFYSKINGNNFYAVTFTPEGTTALDTIDNSKMVIETEYYNLGGIRINQPTEGVYIVKEMFEDGTCKISKKVVR